MIGLREGLEKAQFFQAQLSTSLLEVAAKFGLQPPISLLDMARLLKPETVDWHIGPESSGDDNLVTASADLQLTSTGSWTFSGEIHDSGDGADFALVMALKFIDQFHRSKLFGEASSLSDGESYPFSKQGRDLWIARNWDSIRTKGVHWTLKASTTAGAGEIIGGILTLGLAVLFGAGASECNEQNSWTVEQNPDGSTTATCHLN